MSTLRQAVGAGVIKPAEVAIGIRHRDEVILNFYYQN